MTMMFDKIGSPTWRVRRRIIVATLLWCAGMVTYLAIWGRPISLSETTVNALILLMGSIIGSYVFGVVWDDKNKQVAPPTVEVKATLPAQPPADPKPPEGFAQ